ncbi:MAG: sensor domain-containing diguanylate cyclase [Desulfovibrionaceae bacterium]|nr:GGDEF domain-containing protein [Desulfovibrionaceae bacterium]MDD4951998.1 sensor domain-containing diguanylate cyclase [Desulfovibrionaceae bacterium]
MNRGKRPELMWGLGLTEAEKSQIERASGPGFFLKNFPDGSFPGKKDLEREEKPSAAWIPWRAWNRFPPRHKKACRGLESTHRILLQEERDEPVELEQVIEQGFLTVVRSPLTRTKVQDALFRAKEVSSLYADIYRMTREIFLERELLARKSEQLEFLNRILAGASQSLDAASILSRAREDLAMLIPVSQLNAAFWRKGQDTGLLEAEIFLSSKMPHKARQAWVDMLLGQVAALAGPVGGFQTCFLDPAGRPGENCAPSEGRVMVLPLASGEETFGCLVMLCEQDLRLAKDQVEILRSAASHLSLALRNALAFKDVKIKADRDGLTRIHNRRSFDERLMQELKRHQRYDNVLSLLMLDLDHFKQVNDTYGHKAGDMVLERIAGLLVDTLRATDFPARYGGEEFVVLLPHTGENQAWILAERIRAAVAETGFESEGRCFGVTASIGVASLDPGTLDRDCDLVLQADRALYRAKDKGRNTVVVSGREALPRTVNC